MRAVFAMSLIAAGLSLAAGVGFSAVTVVPRPGAETLRATEMTLAAIFFFGWLILALWARTRQYQESTRPVPGWLKGALVGIGGLYSIGIIFGVR